MAETTSADFMLNYTVSGYMGSFENTTSECFTLSYQSRVLLGVCMGVSFCGLVDNAIVMRFLFFHTKKNPFTIYTLNLAVADFSLLLLFSLLMLLILTLTICSLFNSLFFSYVTLHYIIGFLCHFFHLSSLGLLTAISVERCVSVLFPIWYRCRRPKHLSGIVSGLLWAFSGSFVFLMYLSFSFSEEHLEALGAVATAICVMFSSIMLISNLSLFIKLRCGFQRRHPGKLYIAILISVIFFFAFAMPFSVEVFLNLANSQELFPKDPSLLLAMLNSSTNPVIYFLVGCCQQRRSLCSVTAALRRVFEEKETSEEGSHTTEDKTAETMV
ncbi:mas-related G-protein coupled receptor member H-like [Numida meleagris]|uniref:mas-related G-protein coupled receptor member H-like n=1 Tax=Numida meleagris TaxID=8996 RepID=UPI000B3E382F|nr:mas-related G-protein coupled receptor member H-like [Numida meleagris]XP_021256811.1 mas-related G-protein coupled receptor member H-like [Numida meleagris]XP_021256812.1 mas-related G-protein coupled receptor member H-like [Numida meleagris]XP_021256813.1 mas-related G-protein coupled receptor member H-like [Numida meleagris]XP_021256814.1 mas-related G-protein coupled receptor member H-like [Numida meleagris]XP_021256815.1 mas-related G-protein coupled receptor member H-like [Numida mele